LTGEDFDEPQIVEWSITHAGGNLINIPDEMYLGTLVETEGFCKAWVDVKVTNALRVTLGVWPWRKDDPLLFNGSTTKGGHPRRNQFDKFDDSSWSELIHGLSGSKVDDSSKKVYRVRGIPSDCPEDSFVKAVSEHLDLDRDGKEVVVHTFVRDPYCEEQNVAIVSFLKSVKAFRSEREDCKENWSVSCSYLQQGKPESNADGGPQKMLQVTFDTSFEGFTALGRTLSDPEPQVE